VLTVTAADLNGNSYTASPSAATGAYTLTGVVPGTYDLRFEATTGWQEPATRTVIVGAGATADAGTSTSTVRSTMRGTVTWTENNQNFTATSFLGGSVTSNSLGTSLVFNAESIPRRAAGSVGVGVSFTGTGTYQIGGFITTSRGYANYVNLTGNPFATVTNSLGNNAYSGTCTITSYNATTRTITGTFNFGALSTSTNIAATTVSNGTFNITY